MRPQKVTSECLVSVCIQTYQHALYIRECLDSVLSQKVDFAWEIIIGEDESTDGTREICLEYAKKYPDLIRLFLRSRRDVICVSGKPTGRYNMIENIKAARGKYIALLEGDDFWIDSFKLQKQVDFLEENPDCIACHHWHKYAIRDEKSGEFVLVDAPIKGQGYFPEKTASVERVFSNSMRLKSRTVMYRNVLNTFPSWFYKVAYGDVALSMLLGQYGDFGFIDEPMAVYRQTGEGVSAFNPENPKEVYDHLIQWIRVWEFGIKHYNGEYLNEGLRTIESFYKAMLSTSSYYWTIYLRAASFALAGSCLPIHLRVEVLITLSKLFIRGKILRRSGGVK